MKRKTDFSKFSPACLLITKCFSCGLIVPSLLYPTSSSHSLLQNSSCSAPLGTRSISMADWSPSAAHPHFQFIFLAVPHIHNMSTKQTIRLMLRSTWANTYCFSASAFSLYFAAYKAPVFYHIQWILSISLCCKIKLKERSPDWNRGNFVHFWIASLIEKEKYLSW